MYSELGWVWLPCILLAAVLAAARHWKKMRPNYFRR